MEIPEIHIVNESERGLKFTIVAIFKNEVQLPAKSDKIIERGDIIMNARTIRIIVREW